VTSAPPLRVNEAQLRVVSVRTHSDPSFSAGSQLQ